MADDDEADIEAYTWIEPKPSLLQVARNMVDTDDSWALDPLQGIWSGLPGEHVPIAYESRSGWGTIQGTLLASSGSWMGGSPGGSGTGQGMLGMGPVTVPESNFTGFPPGTPPGLPPGSPNTSSTYIALPSGGPGDRGGGGGSEPETSVTTTSESSQPYIEIRASATATLVMLGLVITVRTQRRR